MYSRHNTRSQAITLDYGPIAIENNGYVVGFTSPDNGHVVGFTSIDLFIA